MHDESKLDLISMIETSQEMNKITSNREERIKNNRAVLAAVKNQTEGANKTIQESHATKVQNIERAEKLKTLNMLEKTLQTDAVLTDRKDRIHRLKAALRALEDSKEK